MKRTAFYGSSLLLLISIAFSLGCPQGGPGGPPTYPVSGTVTYNGEPVGGANVTFVAGQGGQSAVGVTDASGKYELTTFAAGASLVFLDEFNRCREMARNGIMPALDSTRKMYNPLTGSTIDIPDNVLWIAAINNGAQFTGRRRQHSFIFTLRRVLSLAHVAPDESVSIAPHVQIAALAKEPRPLQPLYVHIQPLVTNGARIRDLPDVPPWIVVAAQQRFSRLLELHLGWWRIPVVSFLVVQPTGENDLLAIPGDLAVSDESSCEGGQRRHLPVLRGRSQNVEIAAYSHHGT